MNAHCATLSLSMGEIQEKRNGIRIVEPNVTYYHLLILGRTCYNRLPHHISHSQVSHTLLLPAGDQEIQFQRLSRNTKSSTTGIAGTSLFEIGPGPDSLGFVELRRFLDGSFRKSHQSLSIPDTRLKA